MSRGRAAIMAAGLAALLYGCAHDKPVPLSAAANAQTLESRSLHDPRLLTFIHAALAQHGHATVPSEWDLSRLTLAALYFHPDIRIAQDRLAAAQAAELTARERPNPVLNLTNIIDQAAVPGALPAAAAAITIGPIIDFVVETAGKREARTARARRLAEAATWDLTTAAWQVRSHLRDALLDLWGAQRRLASIRQQQVLQQALVQLLQARLAAGEASAPEVDRERIRYARTVVQRSDLRRNAAEARARLAAAIGIPEAGLDDVEIATGTFARTPPAIGAHRLAQWRRNALTQRSDVQAGLASYAAAQAALRLAIANQYPNLTLGPGYNYDAGVNRYMLDASTTLPLFHHAQGAVAEAAAHRREAAAQFTKLQAGIIAAIDQAAAAYRLSSQGVAAADAVLADERRYAARAEAAFRAGQTDRPSLESARLVLVTAEQDQFDQRVHQRQALAALEDALHRPLFDPNALLTLPDAGAGS